LADGGSDVSGADLASPGGTDDDQHHPDHLLAFLTAAAGYACLFVAVRPAVRGVTGQVGLGILGACARGTVGRGAFVADPVVTPLVRAVRRSTAPRRIGTRQRTRMAVPWPAGRPTDHLPNPVPTGSGNLDSRSSTPASPRCGNWFYKFLPRPSPTHSVSPESTARQVAHAGATWSRYASTVVRR
jgi:hypothetical protein